MDDGQIRTVLRGLVTESPDIGETPRHAILEYLTRTASTAEDCARAGAPITGGPMKGTEMTLWEGPTAVFEAYVRDALAYRALTRGNHGG